ncbi:MAG TPA: ABC transporter ATP-binding protein, partial [Solirubrobacterales bacterium]
MSTSTSTTRESPHGALLAPSDRDGDRAAAAPPAIVVEDVCKTFRIPVHKRTTLKERALHPFARIPTRELTAAQNVSFSVQKGEFFGIVGRNGSGKSTLLKLLTGIYRADSGDVRIEGRVSPLIELGVGFNSAMAARDNVLVNGTLLGLSRSQALGRFDEIIEFAGLEQFQDLPLKNYSSGMLMRLAFSISIHVDGDVLLLDEVLAVGDSGFQDKCNEAFRRLKKDGKTIVLVTHAMDAVRRFCDRAMLMEEGRVVEIGDPEDVAELYLDTAATEPGLGPKDTESERHGDGSAEITTVWVEGEDGEPNRVFKQGGQLTICAEVEFKQAMEEPKFAFVIRAEDGRNVFSK